MSKVFNSEMEKSIRFGQYYCSPCAKAYDKNMVAKLSGATGIHINFTTLTTLTLRTTVLTSLVGLRLFS